MSSYRMSSCSECGVKKPFDELQRVTVKETSGYSTSKRNTRTYYKYINKRMCGSCYKAYQLYQNIKTCLYLVGAGLLGLFIFSGSQKQNHAPPSATLPSVEEKSEDTHQTLPEAAQRPSIPQVEGARQEGSQPQDDYSPANSMPSPSMVPTAPAQPPPQLVAPEQVMVVTFLANVRSAPNNGPIVDQVPPGEQLTVVETRGAWAEVRKGPAIIGWVHLSLLQPLQ